MLRAGTAALIAFACVTAGAGPAVSGDSFTPGFAGFSVEPHGEVLRDIYDRDPRILEALDGEFRFNLPEDLRETHGG